MASAQSLIGLVNQLQTMESTFSTIMMEAIMKLASLTDSNVFVMVETAEGRRFCGKRHLCDQYLHGGGLAPIGNDIEMDVDVNVTSVREKQGLMAGGNLANYHHHANLGMAQTWTNSAQPAGRKRQTTYTNASYSKHQKMAAAAAVIQQQQAQQQQAQQQQAQQQAQQQQQQQQQPMTPEEAAQVQQQAQQQQQQQQQQQLQQQQHKAEAVKAEADREREAGEERGVVEREATTEEDLRARETAAGGGAVVNWPGNLVSENAYQAFHGGMANAPVVNVSNEQLEIDEETLDVLLTQNSKADILRTVTESEVFEDGESAIVKLLNSHLYDVAKGGANLCPIRCRKDPRCRSFFRSLFEGWWNSFPNFQDLSTLGVKVQLNNATRKPIKTYIRTRMQANFGWAIEYMAKGKPVVLE